MGLSLSTDPVNQSPIVLGTTHIGATPNTPMNLEHAMLCPCLEGVKEGNAIPFFRPFSVHMYPPPLACVQIVAVCEVVKNMGDALSLLVPCKSISHSIKINIFSAEQRPNGSMGST